MLQIIKSKIQQYMSDRAQLKYEAEVTHQRETYSQWILKQEGLYFDRALSTAEEVNLQQKSEVIYYENCGKEFSIDTIDKEYLLFASKKGKLRDRAIVEMIELFESNPDYQLIYGDEDYTDQYGKRCEPWFKPNWSPDTLLSFFYFGSVFAVRKKNVQNIKWLNQEGYFENIYDFVLKATENMTGAIHHCDTILYHNLYNGAECKENVVALNGADRACNAIKLEAVKRRGLQAKMVNEGEENPYYAVVYEAQGAPLVSIIIPSKDNAEVLEKCLLSIKNNTRYKNYEIIIVDNGSNDASKAMLEQLKENYQFHYLYEPMEFNFSKMCNRGVKVSKGDYIVLLNDDCEVLQEEWLEKMLGQASLEHVGAVGAKLLYPEEHLIQHVGITNLEVGPAHKLVGLSDEEIYYHGQNRLVYDMIGVTAACLMVAKNKYEKVHGFCEAIEVAYNDVDFCFSLLEQGFYNVQRNDVTLCHHESLSRGDDGEDEEKWKRLLSEKDKLFARHPQFYQFDPFYSKHLAGYAREYRCSYLYDFENRSCYLKLKRSRINFEHFLNNCLQVKVEYIKLEQKLETKDPDVYLIEGWSYIMGVDNSHYKRQIILTNESGHSLGAPVLNRYRKDVARTFPDEVNIALSGFVCRIPVGVLDKESYAIALLAKDTCSRQYLCTKVDTRLEIWK